MKIYEKLRTIQQKLNAPKSRRNDYGKYDYRSCEDIFEAVKPLLEETGCVLTVTDELVQVGERYYIKATATLICDTEKDEAWQSERIQNVAYAREPEDKKGADAAQITGACSSYARKYALNGLFLIDDVKDADDTNHHGKDEPEQKKKEPEKAVEAVKKMAEEDINRKVTKEEVQAIVKACKENGVEIGKVCRLYKKDSLPEMSLKLYKHVMSHWAEIKAAE